MIKSMILGDSVAYGSLNTVAGGRVVRHPQIILNERQRTFDFSVNHAVPGASWAGVFSQAPAVRQANGLPGGVTLSDLVASTDCRAVLFNFGGNDDASTAEGQRRMAGHIRGAANICSSYGKLFAFVGVIDVSAKDSWEYASFGATSIYDLHLPQACRIACSAEVLRQTCLAEGYPYIDVRNVVRVSDWGDVTGDEVHPTQGYYEAIFSAVAAAIGG